PRRGCAEVEAYAIGSQAAMAADVVETPVALFRRDLAQDVPELGLERRECLNQRGGVELAGDAGRERVGRIVGKVRFVSLCVQHRGRSSLLLGEHRLAAVKVGLSMSCRLCFAVACGGGVTPGLPATRDEGRAPSSLRVRRAALRRKLEKIGGAVARNAR